MVFSLASDTELYFSRTIINFKMLMTIEEQNMEGFGLLYHEQMYTRKTENPTGENRPKTFHTKTITSTGKQRYSIYGQTFAG